MREKETIEMKIHQLRIDFSVTETVKRFVYVYVIEAGSCWLVDSGVYGSETRIIEYLTGIGRKPSDIKGVFLTHAHPDHIGSAAWLREHTGCTVYASAGEKPWIENINLQFRERPIPNFYALAGESTPVDVTVKDGDAFELEQGLIIRAVRTAGHSAEGMSYRAENLLFIGDAVPVKGDIPILIDEGETRNTLEILERMPGIETYYPAWDRSYDRDMMIEKIAGARELIGMLKTAVTALDDGSGDAEMVGRVCECLKMPMLAGNPLFAKTIACLRSKKGTV